LYILGTSVDKVQRNRMEWTSFARGIANSHSSENLTISQGPRLFNSVSSATQAYQRKDMKNEIVADSYDVHDSFIHKEEQKNSEITTLLQDTETENSLWNIPNSKLVTKSSDNPIINQHNNNTSQSTEAGQVSSDPPANSCSIHRETEKESFSFYNMFREKDEEFVWKLSLLSQRRKVAYLPFSSANQRNGKRKKWHNESDLSDMEIDEDSELYRTIRKSFRIVKDNKKNGRLRSQQANNLSTRNNYKKKAKNDKQQSSEVSLVSSGVWFWDTKCRQAVAICLDKDTLTRDISEIFKSTSST